MNKILVRSILLIVVIFIFGAGEELLACWCRMNSSCQNTNRASSVFVGKVVKVTPDGKSDDGDDSYSRTVRFRIEESFFGTNRKVVDVRTGSEFGPGDCLYYPFETDKTYLVFANENDDRKLRVGECGGTKEISKANDDLKYLRKLQTGTENGIISGNVFGFAFESTLERYERSDLFGIPIQLTGRGVEKTISTDKNGNFVFKNLKAGEYKLRGFFPVYYGFKSDEFGNESEIILNGRGCSENWFFPDVKNSIEGTVFDKNYKPLKGAEVYLIPEAKFTDDDTENIYDEITDENGKYRFDFIFPRRYVLGIKTIESDYDDEEKPNEFYPSMRGRSDAKVIDFGLGDNLTGYDLIWKKL